MLDFMNYIEFGEPTKYFYGKTIFEQIKSINKIKHAGSDREYATIFTLQNFKEYKLERFRAAQIASMMLNYRGAFESDARDQNGPKKLTDKQRAQV